MAESWNWAGDDKYKKRQRQRSFVRGVLLTTGLLLFVADSSPPCRADDDSASSVPRETWLKMAADELRNAAPDDAGFAEGWMPIAEAWQLVGNDAEARDAIRSAREALPRMTLVERVIESTIDLCQHESFDQAFSEQLIRDAARMCEQVSDNWDRSTFYAHLSGLAATLGHRALADSLLKQSLGLINMKLGKWEAGRLVFTQQCRAAAWTEPPSTLLEICRQLERLHSPKPLVNANVYSHVAMAAARHHDRTQFLRGMFRAETALAPVRIENHPNYLYAVRLAEANLLQRRWRPAVIIANNIPDPTIQASILFRVMKDAPQEVRSPHLAQLFEDFAEQRWACSAVAGYVEHRIRSGEDAAAVVEWAKQLPLASQRASAYAGIARVTGSGSTESAPSLTDGPVFDRPDIAQPYSLVEAAEQLAAKIEHHHESAFAWTQVARTWNLLGKTRRYRHAVAEVDDSIFEAWGDVWIDRPPVMPASNGSYIDSDDRHIKKEQETVGSIVVCLRELSGMQTDMDDARGAMETCLNLANAAGFLSARQTIADFSFLHLKSMAGRLQSETGIGPDAFPSEEHYDVDYTSAMLAAGTKDLAGLQARIPKLADRAETGSRRERAQLARAQCELTILYAERGNLSKYRDARRSAQSQITQGKAASAMKCMLATADALAGEFALAEANLVPGTVAWFGDANRPRSRLAIALANDGQWQKAISHAEEIPLQYPVWRGDSWEAIAKARFKDEPEARDGLLGWVETLEAPTDRVGALCGLALAASRQ